MQHKVYRGSTLLLFSACGDKPDGGYCGDTEDERLNPKTDSFTKPLYRFSGLLYASTKLFPSIFHEAHVVTLR
jgi:hypothetical protein